MIVTQGQFLNNNMTPNHAWVLLKDKSKNGVVDIKYVRNEHVGKR